MIWRGSCVLLIPPFLCSSLSFLVFLPASFAFRPSSQCLPSFLQLHSFLPSSRYFPSFRQMLSRLPHVALLPNPFFLLLPSCVSLPAFLRFPLFLQSFAFHPPNPLFHSFLPSFVRSSGFFVSSLGFVLFRPTFPLLVTFVSYYLSPPPFGINYFLCPPYYAWLISFFPFLPATV